MYFKPVQVKVWKLCFVRFHCPMSTATTHIGSSCACSGGQSRFWSRFGNCSRQIYSSSGQPPKTNHITFSCCRHCDVDVVIRSTNGHPVLITRLLSLSSGTCQGVLFFICCTFIERFTSKNCSKALKYKNMLKIQQILRDNNLKDKLIH